MCETKRHWFVWICAGEILWLYLALTVFAQAPGAKPQEIFDRAVVDFQDARVAESADGFDNLARLVPSIAPELWQRGIALYYAGRYKECRTQFELHRMVNPNDVENAAWHFLCVARAESPEKARSAILPVGPDARVPMRQVYEMFLGKMTPEQVLAAAGNRADGQFYAQLYIGLYFEAIGNDRLALQHITSAAAERFAPAGGYMHTVAKVHLAVRQRKP
jgi:lipoprotein NlpI